jgi:hypothetical protein
MFIKFFYLLRQTGIPVSPTSFLRLQRAMSIGLITSVNDFYTAARSILIKSERYFDLYDQIFTHHFEGAELKDPDEYELSEAIKTMLDKWLSDPKSLADAMGVDEKSLAKMTPEELVRYFIDLMKGRKGENNGSGKGIGRGGRSFVGHSGYHPGGMRAGGISKNRSAVEVAMDRRYRDYSRNGPLNQSQIGEALKRLRNLVPAGPKDVLNVEKTIRRTTKNAGEIDIVFDRSMRDRLKVILAIDNGGWSMEPFIEVVQTLFGYARDQFGDLKNFFFHNTIYDFLWEDPARLKKPFKVEELSRLDPETRFIIVGDANMAYSELMAQNGSINLEDVSGIPSYKRLQFIAGTFSHSVWLNPISEKGWKYTQTINAIREVFPMFELTLDGLEKAVESLMRKT